MFVEVWFLYQRVTIPIQLTALDSQGNAVLFLKRGRFVETQAIV